MRLFRFQSGKGMAAPKGKPEYADGIEVELDRGRAFDVVREILRQIEQENEVISFYLFGQIGAHEESDRNATT